MNVEEMMKSADKKTISKAPVKKVGRKPKAVKAEEKEDKKVMGRPKKDPKSNKSKKVTGYLTQDENKQLEEMAENREMTVSNLVRKFIVAGLKNEE